MSQMRLIDEDEQEISFQSQKIKRKIVVLSGKGGVGKSTVATNLALAFAKKFGKGKVGIIDLDLSGPNIPKMLGIEDKKVQAAVKSPVETGKELLEPVEGPLGLKVVSMGFFLETRSTPVVWRGPIKIKALRQFMDDFDWGDLEMLIFDMPPGTGDEALSVMQLLPEMDGVVIVTTPQEVALLDTGKSLTMSREMQRPVIGIVENMATFRCPDCGTQHPIFGEGGGQRLAKEFNTDLLGQIPLDPVIRVKEDQGISKPFDYFVPIVDRILEKIDSN
ncbi:MAG: Mrp/NBP35 family ATP-binding protein [Candidatus Heimdallarchaeota archaeon]